MKSIFLAEGEKHVRSALRLQLELQPAFRISGEAGHAEALLAQVCQNPPDVILLDWNLPGIHPQRLVQTLRAYCPDTRILATSVKPETEFNMPAHGIDGFLSKQCSPKSFITALNEAVCQNGKDKL